MIDIGNLTNQIDLSPFDFVATNCHTADEEVRSETELVLSSNHSSQISVETQDWGMMGVIAFFAGLVLIGTVVDVTLNILHLDDVFSDSFVQMFQGFSLYTNTLKLFHCPEPGASGSLDCINGIRFTKGQKPSKIKLQELSKRLDQVHIVIFQFNMGGGKNDY